MTGFAPVPKIQAFRNFSPEEHETWRLMFAQQAAKRDSQIHPLFSRGIEAIGMGADRVPDLDAINSRLERLTGFRGVPVEGLEEDASFYQMLAERRFPIGNFIRDRKDLAYTPAPDVFHDLYGHLPFLADREYADFCAELGRRTMSRRDRPEVIQQFARLFWFAIEFGLIETTAGRRIFGAGIASSIGECDFALSDKPRVLPFDIEVIRNRDFRVDEFQGTLFLIRDLRDLYSCLPEFERRAAG